jgi:ATP-dependent helicase/nuclease subunit A
MDQLIADILDSTHYMLYLKSMPDGYKRLRNVELLQNRAVSYEHTSYQGIFNFIRYVDFIDKYDIELGEASILSEHDQVVRLMSIHKSKGLEFPVVFLAGMGKKFNMTDLNDPVVIHQDYGVGIDYVNIVDRYRMPTLKKNLIKTRLKKESLEEELRVLYVAMTRAREKLFLIGTVRGMEKAEQKWSDVQFNEYYKEQCNSYQDWIMPLVLKGLCQMQLHKSFVIETPLKMEIEIHKSDISYVDEKIVSALLDWTYTDEIYTSINTTMSVTDLKNRKTKQSGSDSNTKGRAEESFFEPIIPSFVQTETEVVAISGARKGTIYHQLLYDLDRDIEPTREAIDRAIENMVHKGSVTSVEGQVIDVDKIIALFEHPIWLEVKEADEVHKETAFVLGIDAHEIVGTKEKYDDFVMVQGIVDLFFVNYGSVTIIDYKTDYITSGDEQLLVDRYKEQLILYRQAIERATNLPVEKCYIYALQTNAFIGV